MPGHAAARAARRAGPLAPRAAGRPGIRRLRPSSGSDLKHVIIRTHVRARWEDYLIRTYVHMAMPRVPGRRGRRGRLPPEFPAGRRRAGRRWDSVGRRPSWSLNVESVMQLSARNQIPATVTSINAGEAIANVELAANGVRLVASITVEAVRQLGLAEGSNVTAVIKASDVILATD